MKINKKFVLTSIAIGGLATVGALATATVSFAATNPTTDNPIISRVAQILGMDNTKLKDALKQASTEQIDQMVKDGKITQAKADKLKADVANGELRGFDDGFRGKMGGMMGPKMEMTNLATFLGITETDLKTALDGNQKLADVITSKGKTVANAKAYLITKQTEEINQNVKDGKITQAQADKILSNQSAMLDKFLNGTMPKFGGRGLRMEDDSTNQ